NVDNRGNQNYGQFNRGGSAPAPHYSAPSGGGSAPHYSAPSGGGGSRGGGGGGSHGGGHR
ncbi:MAG TPA: hypothetical protein VFW30_09085, partial [Bryocella sp.]|nr:hypothetical protein [Bryocella sp.]